MKVATLLRTSTARGQSVESQRLELGTWATARGWTVVEYDEGTATSGGLDLSERPVLVKLLADAALPPEVRPFDAVAATDAARFGRRDAGDTLHAILCLWHHRVPLYLMESGNGAEPLDMNDMGDLVMTAVKCGIGKLYRDRTVTLTSAALNGHVNAAGQAVSRKGNRLGRPEGVLHPDVLALVRANAVDGVPLATIRGEPWCVGWMKYRAPSKDGTGEWLERPWRPSAGTLRKLLREVRP